MHKYMEYTEDMGHDIQFSSLERYTYMSQCDVKIRTPDKLSHETSAAHMDSNRLSLIWLSHGHM